MTESLVMPRKMLRATLIATVLTLPAAALALPDGEGRELVEGACASCHGVNLIERSSGNSREDGGYLASTMIGRLDPETGEVRLVVSPRERSRPYGLKVAADGTIWVSCNGANCLLRVDPETMEVTEIPLPETGTTVRRLDVDEDGIIWWANSGLGRLGRYDPETSDIQEWVSPSGPRSHPYAIAVFDGAVRY